MSKRFHNQYGFTLVEALIAASVISMVALSAAGGLSGILQTLSHKDFKDQLGEVRDRVEQAIVSPAGWEFTLRSAANNVPLTGTSALVNCMRAAAGIPGYLLSDCPVGQFQVTLNEVRNLHDQLVIQAANPVNRGFTINTNGSVTACTPFVAPGFPANDLCPMSITIRVDGYCPLGGCTAANLPSLNAVGAIAYNPGPITSKRAGALNSALYSFSQIPGKGVQNLTLAGACASLNGLFNPATQTCALRDGVAVANPPGPAVCGRAEKLVRTGNNTFECKPQNFDVSVAVLPFPTVNPPQVGTKTCPQSMSQIGVNDTDPICARLISRNTCQNAGEYVKSIDDNGNITCGTIPAIPVVPSGVISECESVQQVDSPALGHYYATCPSGKIAIGGGGWCGPLQTIQASEPWPVNSGSGSNQWHVICANFSIIGNASAVCCKVN